MPYIPFTDEQKQLANSVDLAEYLRVRGEKLERAGIEHKLIYCDSSGRHDSNIPNSRLKVRCLYCRELQVLFP